MTGRQFSEVDFDLLADYVGGALDGTPDEATVARLVTDDPAWARAYADVSGGAAAVRADLASWGAVAEPMPAEVTDRLAAALETEGTRARLSVVPDEAGPRTARKRPAAPARRRWPAWGTPVAVAAGVAAVAGFGLAQLDTRGDGADDSAGTTAEAPAAARDEAGGADLSAEQVLASGRDYRGSTLATEDLPVLDARTAKDPTAAQGAAPKPLAVGPLDRLADPAARSACVDAIAGEHNQGPAVVQVVDYASYERSPALVVFFVDGAGERWVWAAGPNCGLPAAGADTRGSAKIG